MPSFYIVTLSKLYFTYVVMRGKYLCKSTLLNQPKFLHIHTHDIRLHPVMLGYEAYHHALYTGEQRWWNPRWTPPRPAVPWIVGITAPLHEKRILSSGRFSVFWQSKGHHINSDLWLKTGHALDWSQYPLSWNIRSIWFVILKLEKNIYEWPHFV